MTDVVYCPGPAVSHTWCGRYATRERAVKSTGDKAWRFVSPSDNIGSPQLLCPDCYRARLKSRVRAALMNGVRLDTASMSPEEREAATQVLGTEFLAAVDGGWGGDDT